MLKNMSNGKFMWFYYLEDIFFHESEHNNPAYNQGCFNSKDQLAPNEKGENQYRIKKNIILDLSNEKKQTTGLHLTTQLSYIRVVQNKFLI